MDDADDEHLREAVTALADEDLLRMLASPAEDYTPSALKEARREVARRGGEAALEQRLAQETAQEASVGASAEVESRPWRKILHGAVWCLGGIVVVATAPEGSEPTFRLLAWMAILFGGFLVVRGAVQTIWFRPSGIYLDPTDPLWQQAARQARESIPTLHDLARDQLADISVKFPFVTDSGERELVWGKLRAITDSAVHATVETVPIAHAGAVPDELATPLAELLDWHLELPDGSIRGSFTTQAEIVLRERLALALPRQVAAMRGKFVDRLRAQDET